MCINLFSVNCEKVINGKIGFCACHSCPELEGDCDFDYQCQGDLKCGSNNCPATFGFDNHTDCCYSAIVGDENFCRSYDPCDVNEGDCDSDDECKSHLFCGSNNCPDLLGYSSSVDCCEPKGNILLLVMFQLLSTNSRFFFQLLTDSCVKNYCQDGLQVYFSTETQNVLIAQIYGYYELQPIEINGRPYFKMGPFGFWWDGVSRWWIGYDPDNIMLGQSFGVAYYEKDVFCPHQLLEWEWAFFDGTDWRKGGKDIGIKCKFQQKKVCTSPS